MEASTVVTIRDNTAIIPALNGISNSAKDNIDANSASLNDSSASSGSNGNTGGSSRTQQQKITNGTAAIQSQRTTTIATPEPNNNARQKRAAAGIELKSMIIEFMRDKPYLWNRWHPGYNDNKRRENEFSLFSHDINYPVSEIKRVWHVLRTNFFRAHKIQAEKGVNVGPDSGERCWKYYQSMKFILQGTHNNTSDEVPNNNSNNNSNNNESINDDSSSSVKDIRQTRSSKMLKVARGSRRAVQRITQPPINSTSDSSNNSSNAPSALTITAAAATTATTAVISNSTPIVSMASDSITFSSGTKSNHSRSLRAHRDDNHDISTITNISPDQFGLAHGRTSTLSAFNEMSRISFDADDDHLYARSLTSTLKKFDPTTKEVIKLKFQEIIVEYMQKHQQQLHLYQQQQQQQSGQATTTTTQPKQTQE